MNSTAPQETLDILREIGAMSEANLAEVQQAITDGLNPDLGIIRQTVEWIRNNIPTKRGEKYWVGVARYSDGSFEAGAYASYLNNAKDVRESVQSNTAWNCRTMDEATFHAEGRGKYYAIQIIEREQETNCPYCGHVYLREYKDAKWTSCPKHGDYPLHMSQWRYVAALVRICDQIANGLPLSAWDCTIPGNKETHCSWGLCSGEMTQWPDAQDHLWPWLFEKHGRVAPLYRGQSQFCPLDEGKNGAYGCFYRCLVFQHRVEEKDRGQVLRLYEAAITSGNQNSDDWR